MILFSLLLIIPFIIFCKYVKYHFEYWERRRIPHNKPAIPTGNMQEWMRSKHFAQIFCETYEKFKGSGPYAGFYFNMQKALIVLDLQLARTVLVKHFVYFERRGLFHNETDDPLTGNLFLLDGPKWRSLRTKLTPIFSAAKMKYMYSKMLKVGEELQEVFSEKIVESGNGVVDVTYLLGRFTADVIGNCVFGLDCHSLKDPTIEFCVMARKFFSQRRHPALVDSLINCFPEWAKILRMKIIPQDVTDFYMKTVRDTIRYREENNIKQFDFMDLLIELKNQPDESGEENLTPEELTAQAFAFFIAAFDTCSTTMSYALYELAHNKGIQDKLRQDIEKVLQSHKQKLTYECLKEMRYLDQVISETLRKYPVAPALFRKCNRRFATSNPHYYIEKDCMIIIPTLSYHHDAEFFPQPLKFDPERFSPINVKNIKPGSYLPFGEGPRNCIGMRFGRMHTSIGLMQLIKNFQFEVCDQTKTPIEIVIPSFNLNPLDITLKVAKV